MSIQILFLLVFLAIVMSGFIFFQWLGGQKAKPTIFYGRDQGDEFRKDALHDDNDEDDKDRSGSG